MNKTAAKGEHTSSEASQSQWSYGQEFMTYCTIQRIFVMFMETKIDCYHFTTAPPLSSYHPCYHTYHHCCHLYHRRCQPSHYPCKQPIVHLFYVAIS